ncbi:MAG: c-type cytochrome [Mariniblastus sp.]|nr:c-type cytochrome [Mariniblastus sp.]
MKRFRPITIASTLLLSPFFLIAVCTSPADEPDESGKLNLLVDAIGSTPDDTIRASLIQGLLSGLEGRRNVPEPENWSRLRDALIGNANPLVRERSLQLAQVFGDPLATQQALNLVMDETAELGRRKSALYLLLNQQNKPASNLLAQLIQRPDWIIDSIRGYAIIENPDAVKVLLNRYPDFDSNQKRAALDTLSSRPVYAEALADAVANGTIPRTDIPAQISRTLLDILGDRWISIYGERGDTNAQQREATIDRYRELCSPNNMRKADSSRGRVVFEKTCAACHELYGIGGKVGPDLTGSNRANLDYILLNSVDPSFDVADSYKTTVIQTVDGRVINGVLAEEDETRVVLKTAEQPRVVIAKENIEGRKLSTKSMMPEGQLDQMTEQEVIDLIQYLRSTEQVGIETEETRNELPHRQHKDSDAEFLSPSEAVSRMAIPDGFDVTVFASEPHIAEPIAFCFDGKGRLWVVENLNYQTRRKHTNDPISRIQILEDTDSDGVFDSKKTFTDTLTFTSGLAVGMGGVFVGSPPHMSFIPDANGDDVPDGPPQILLDGWGINDRHETLNSFNWGPDGWLYGCHGVFTQSLVGKPTTPNKDRQFIDGGIWRYHPTEQRFEVYARGLSNPWGFDFNDQGQGFATCCVIPHLFHIIQGGVYDKQSLPHVNPHIYDDIKTIRTHTHLSAHGGARFYLADTFPEEYRDRLFMCNIHEHAVLTDAMVPKGSGFIGQHGDDFMPTNDMAWVGFSVEMGPDGGVYILDWHDQDVCGNSVKFPNSGRVYRIVPENVEPITRPNMPAATDSELVALQRHTNDWYVRQARTELQHRSEKGSLNREEVHQLLWKQFETSDSSAKRLRALWCLYVTQGIHEHQLLNTLQHDDPYVRAWTLQFLGNSSQLNAFLPDTRTTEPDPPTWLTAFLDSLVSMAQTDTSPVVRLYLASLAQRLPYDARWKLLAPLATHGEDLDDHNITKMIWFGLEPMVTQSPAKALNLAGAGKLPRLNEFVARRIVSGKAPNKEFAKMANPAQGNRSINKVAPGFQIKGSGEGGVVLHNSFRNRRAVQTHPVDRDTPCILYSTDYDIPEGKTTTMNLRVSHHPHGDWQMRVFVDGEVVADRLVASKTVGKDEWLNVSIDLSPFAGKRVNLWIENRANGWKNEWAYWNRVNIVSE